MRDRYSLYEAKARFSAIIRQVREGRRVVVTVHGRPVADRLLHAEIAKVLGAGYDRGADCWHMACALYLAEDPAEVVFLTLDERQGATDPRVGRDERPLPRPFAVAPPGLEPGLS